MDPNSYQYLLFLNGNIQSAQEHLPLDIKQEVSQVIKPFESLLNIQIDCQQRHQNIKFDLFDSSSLLVLQNKIKANLKSAQFSLENNKLVESKEYLSSCMKWLYQQQIIVEQKQLLKTECKKNQEKISNLFITKEQRIIEDNKNNLNALTVKQAEEVKIQNQQFAKKEIERDSLQEKIKELETPQTKQVTFQQIQTQSSFDNCVQENNSKLVSSVPQKIETQIKPTVILPPNKNSTYKYQCVIFVEKKDYEKYLFVNVSRFQLCNFSQWLKSVFGLSPKSFLKELNINLQGYSQNEISHLIIILPNYLDKKLNDSHNGELLVLLRQIKQIKPQVLTITDQYNNVILCQQIQRGVGNFQKVKILNTLTQKQISESVVNEEAMQEQMKKNQLKQQIIEKTQTVIQQQAQSLENEKKQQLSIAKKAQESKEHLNNLNQNQQKNNELKKQITEINNSMQSYEQDIQQLKGDQNKCIQKLKQEQEDKLKEFQRVSSNLMKYLNQVQIDSSISDAYFSQVKEFKISLERKELQLQKVLFLIDQKDCVGLLLKLSKNLKIFTSEEFISLDVIIKKLIDKLINPQKNQSKENLVEVLKTTNLLNFISSAGVTDASQDTELSKSIKNQVEVFDLQQYFNSLSKVYDNEAERIEKAKDILASQVV